MKKSIKSFIHQPKKVAIVSLFLAIIIGVFGYYKINKAPVDKFTGKDITTFQNTALSFAANGKIENILVKVGDKVKSGTVLATLNSDNKDGSFIQAEANYETAKANYQKIINGATGTAVDLTKASVNSAQVNLDEITKQQETLVGNAYRTLLNSYFQAQSVSDNSAYDLPIITGTYTCQKEGTYNLKTYGSSGGISINYSGIEEGSLLLTDVPRPIGSCGLFLSFDKTKTLQAGVEYTIQIPNKNASNYNLNNNNYQLALQTKNQAIALAQASLDQAKASLNLVAISARPEDVAVANAQVENAYGVLISNAGYRNTIILAPTDGIVEAINVKKGETIASGSPVILFSSLTN